MKFAAVVLAALAASATLAFAPAPNGVRPSTDLAAEIRGPTKKAGALSCRHHYFTLVLSCCLSALLDCIG
jgi:hypothetical protein